MKPKTKTGGRNALVSPVLHLSLGASMETLTKNLLKQEPEKHSLRESTNPLTQTLH